MAGAVAIMIALVLFPIAIVIGSGFVAALLGYALQRDGEIRAAGTELADLPD